MEQTASLIKMRWVPFILYTISFLRVLLEDKQLQLDQGFILIFDSEMLAREFCHSYCRNTGNGVKTTMKSCTKADYNRNDLVVFANASKQKEEDADSFLELTNCLPVLLCGGILPPGLRDDHYLFRVTVSDVEYVSSAQFHEDIQVLKSFIIKNVPMIIKQFEQIESSIAYSYFKNRVPYRSLLKVLLSVGQIRKSFIREYHNEDLARQLDEVYAKKCAKRIIAILEFSTGLEIKQLLTEAMFTHVDNQSILFVTSIHKVDVNILTLFKQKKAILFDEEYYYLIEETLRDICAAMLGGYSWLEFKHLMAASGLVKQWDSGFTTKKTVLCQGESTRVRTMLVHKETIFAAADGCSLEDYFNKKGGQDK